jgi:hypothetical protein
MKLLPILRDNPTAREPRELAQSKESKFGLGRSISSGTKSFIATTEHFVDDWCMNLERELMSLDNDKIDKDGMYGTALEDYKEAQKLNSLLPHYEDDEDDTATYSDSMASFSLHSNIISSDISGKVPSSAVVDICSNDRDDEIEIKPTTRSQMKELDEIATSQKAKAVVTPEKLDKAFSELEIVLSKTNNPTANLSLNQDVEVKIVESIVTKTRGNRENSARNPTELNKEETSYGDCIEISIEVIPLANNKNRHRSQSSRNRVLKKFKKAVASAAAKGSLAVATRRKTSTDPWTTLVEIGGPPAEFEEEEVKSASVGNSSISIQDKFLSLENETYGEGKESSVTVTVTSIAIERKAAELPPASNARQKTEDEKSPPNKSLLAREINDGRRRLGKAIMKQTKKYVSSAKSQYSKKKAKLSRKATTKQFKRSTKDHSTRAIGEVLKHRKAAYMRSLSVMKQIEEDEKLNESSDVESLPCVLINVVMDNSIDSSLAETNSSCFSDIDSQSEGDGMRACNGKNLVASDDVAARNTNRVKPSIYRKISKNGVLIWHKSMNIVSKSTRLKKRKKNGNNYQRADEPEELL